MPEIFPALLSPVGRWGESMWQAGLNFPAGGKMFPGRIMLKWPRLSLVGMWGELNQLVHFSRRMSFARGHVGLSHWWN